MAAAAAATAAAAAASDHGTVDEHYTKAYSEDERLKGNSLERLRTEDVMRRYLPRAPEPLSHGSVAAGSGSASSTAVDILDVGGGTGVYALPLAQKGYRVLLVDYVAEHAAAARAASDAQAAVGGRPLLAAIEGDARDLSKIAGDGSVRDAVLLLGPLYHLQNAHDRALALSEAFRVLQPGGRVFAAGISRYASLIDGLSRGLVGDAVFRSIVETDLRTGCHENGGNADYFTHAYFHEPRDLREEVSDAGFVLNALIGVEGPQAYLHEHGEGIMGEPDTLKAVMRWLQSIEEVPSIIGASLHMLAVGTKPVLAGRAMNARALATRIACLEPEAKGVLAARDERLPAKGAAAPPRVPIDCRGLAARVIMGNPAEDPKESLWEWLSDPSQRFPFIVGPDSVEVLTTCKSGAAVLRLLGFEDAWVAHRIKERGFKFKVCIFALDKAAHAVRATWDAVMGLVEEHMPLAAAKLAPHLARLKDMSYSEFIAEAGHGIEGVPEEQSALWTYENYVLPSTPDTLGNARGFLRRELKLTSLFAGDGYTRKPDGTKGVAEYLVPRSRVADLHGAAVATVPVCFEDLVLE